MSGSSIVAAQYQDILVAFINGQVQRAKWGVGFSANETLSSVDPFSMLPDDDVGFLVVWPSPVPAVNGDVLWVTGHPSIPGNYTGRKW